MTKGTARTAPPEMLRTVLELGASLWSVFFLVPTGRGTRLSPLSAPEVEDVLHWLHDVSDLVAVKATEAPHYRRVVIQRARGERPALGALHDQLSAATADLRLGRQPRRVRRPPIDVNAGRGFAFIDHLDDVYPSGFLPHRCGNVTEQGFREIYRTSPLLRALRDPSALTGACGSCEFAEVCGGSRSHAYAVTGDLFADDPTCVAGSAGTSSCQA